MAAFVQKNLQLEQSADPRAVTIPRPDWYFLFLFQFIKLGPELLMSVVIPTVAFICFLVWPFIDAGFGPRVAKRLGWKRWPVPGRNIYTGTGFVVFLAIIALLELGGPTSATVVHGNGLRSKRYEKEPGGSFCAQAAMRL